MIYHLLKTTDSNCPGKKDPRRSTKIKKNLILLDLCRSPVLILDNRL